MSLDADSGFLDSITIFIKGALAFTVSQAWNSAIQDFLEKQVLFQKYGKFVYALVITLVSVYILKVIINVKKLLEKCREGINSQCFQWQKIFIGGEKPTTTKREYDPQ